MTRQSMNKIFTIIVIIIGFAATASACVGEYPTHNHYLFSVFNRSLMNDRFTEMTDKYWQQYMGSDNTSYKWSRDEIISKVKRLNDTELLTYCKLLNSYLDSEIDYDSWDYPVQQQIARRHTVLVNLLNSSIAYKGKRFRNQYALMRMRALFGLKRYQNAMNYWLTTGCKLPQSVYKDIMLNIYAGCLWRTGRKSQAIEIYAGQEDYVSLKYCVRGYRNLAGIQKVYATNPNSPTLNYLVQDFVNNVQETMDQYSDLKTQNLDEKGVEEWIKKIGAKKITTTEAVRFIDFARDVVSKGKTKVPCLWQSAIGCIEHQLRRYGEAKVDLAKAETLAGTPRMKDNARAIYAANSVFTEKCSAGYDGWLTVEMLWLDRKSKEDSKSETLYDTDHYRDVKERMVYNGLVPSLMKNGNTKTALLLLGMMEYGTECRNDYANIYFWYLDTLNVEKLVDYASYIKKQPNDPLESYAWQRTYRDGNYYNDIIGTRLLALGRFDEAIPYLEKVSIKFLNTQNIKPYAYYCDYNKERWMSRQIVKLPDYGSEDSIKLSVNKKLQYCRDILSLQHEYNLMREGEERCAKAYQLATLWYQGSCEGDCWWLKQYGISVYQDSDKVGTLDFMAPAIKLLHESAQSSNFTLKEKSLYALAYMRHNDPWTIEVWDEKVADYVQKVMPQSQQYNAMAALLSLYLNNESKADLFVTRCDILRTFQLQTFQSYF